MASYSASSALAAPADELAWPSDFRHFRLFSPRPFFCLPRPFRDPPRANPTFGLAGTPARQSQHPCGPTVRVWASPNEGAGINAIAPCSPDCKIVPVQGPDCQCGPRGERRRRAPAPRRRARGRAWLLDDLRLAVEIRCRKFTWLSLHTLHASRRQRRLTNRNGPASAGIRCAQALHPAQVVHFMAQVQRRCGL